MMEHASDVTPALVFPPQSNVSHTNLDEDSLPAGVALARLQARRNLIEAEKELSALNVQFFMQRLENDDSEYERITSKCQIFFSMFAQCTVEVKEAFKILCPTNKVNFYTKGSELESLSSIHQLYKTCPISSNPITAADHVYDMLADEVASFANQQMYKFQQYASPGDEGSRMLIISDVMLGAVIEVKEDMEGGPASYWVKHKDQVLVKYLVHLEAKPLNARKVVAYNGVFDFVAKLPDGVQWYDMRKFTGAHWRDASNPATDVLLQAKWLYEGALTDRQKYRGQRQVNQNKKNIHHIGVVMNHCLWKKYEDRRKDFIESGGEEIWAYHATKRDNISGIVFNNLDPNRTPVHGRAYGDGCYFSEFPEFSANYSRECMFVFKLLLLKDQHWKVNRSSQGYCEQIIIRDNSLFKPVYVLLF